jgi:D-tyrosyl-tRNA(Tyr) deacylase
MRALLQRVLQASVAVEGKTIGNIDKGLLIFLGVQKGDDQEKAKKLLHKLTHYRVFNDEQGKMNLNVGEAKGSLLIISQFTLAAETHKGLRPGFSRAADPEQAKLLYEFFISEALTFVPEPINTVATGRFGADMQVSLINDGPVTFLLDV